MPSTKTRSPLTTEGLFLNEGLLGSLGARFFVGDLDYMHGRRTPKATCVPSLAQRIPSELRGLQVANKAHYLDTTNMVYIYIYVFMY